MRKLLFIAAMLAAVACGKDNTAKPDGTDGPGDTEQPGDPSTPEITSGWPGKLVPQKNGAHVHFNTYLDYAAPANEEAMTAFDRAGFNFVRLCVPWHAIETQKGVYDFNSTINSAGTYQDNLDAFIDKGIRTILCLGLASGVHGVAQNVAIDSEAQLLAFENYCKAMAVHWRHAKPVFEVWNEPNLGGFGSYTPEQYVKLAKAARRGVEAGWREGRENEAGVSDPLVIGPAVSNGWARGNMFDKCLDAGLLDVVDGISYHPYCNANANPARRIPEIIGDNITALRNEIERRGKWRGFPIVLTEWGWCSDLVPGNEEIAVDYETMSKLHVRQLIMGYYNDIAINCIYSMEDARSEDMRGSITDKHYGLFHTTGENYAKKMIAKPSVANITRFYNELDGYGYVERIDMGTSGTLNSANDWCLVFRDPSTGDAKLVVWTTERNTTKTSPDLKAKLRTASSVIVDNFTDDPIYIQLTGYTPPA
jgi:hypothetical protein